MYEVVLLTDNGIIHMSFDEFLCEMRARGYSEETIVDWMILPESFAGQGWIARDMVPLGVNWIYVPNYIVDEAMDIVFEDTHTKENQPDG